MVMNRDVMVQGFVANEANGINFGVVLLYIN